MPEISRDDYEKLKEENRVLRELVISLTSRIAELEAKSKKNSQNSNKPPSSDGPRKGNMKNSRKPSGKKSGGQKDHEGTTKELNPEPDKIVTLVPKEDCDCGGKVVLQTDKFTVRQVTDIVPIQEITVEYRAKNGICATCGKIHKASFPAGVEGVVSYGENLRAIATYLTNYQLIPLKRTTELIEDMFGLKISQGTVLASGLDVYGKLAAAEELVKEEILQSEVAHFDESGMRVDGKTHWIHSAGTETCTLYGIHKKRGKEAMDAMGVLPKFKGTAVHDHWKSYYHYDQCAHAECNAHHLRHLKYLYEDLGEAWAEEMACLLLRIKQHIDLCRCFGANFLEQADIDEYTRKYRDILENAAPQTSIEAQRMVRRMIKYEQETLLFMLDFDVPFTNNLAERDIRMPKAKQKISGGFRSDDGAKAFARIRSYISTTKKKGRQVLDGLVAAFEGYAVDFLYPANSEGSL